MTRPALGALVLTALALGTVDAVAQSLGDAARKEAERRGTAPQPGKTYTNETLTPDFTTPAPPPAPAAEVKAEPGAAAKADPTKAGAEGTEAPVDVASDPVEAAKWGVTPRDQQTPSQSDDQNEEYWRRTAAQIKARLAEVSDRIAQLRASLAATPKGAPGSEREIVERAFEKAQTSQKYANEEWQRFEARARQRGIPMEWIR